jgi:pimeloyl-ACP methyl ester carboxylesterase
MRVPVIPLPLGAVEIPSNLSSTNWDGATKIGFRQLGSGPDLLLIMGEHGTMTWWDPQLLELLASSFRVTIFDLPGIGYSENEADTNIASYADATAGLIASLGLVAPVVLGWGLGGEVALSLAERHPGIASRLVLVDTSAGGKDLVLPRHNAAVLLGSTTTTTTACSRLMFPSSEQTARLAWLGQIEVLPPDDAVASAIQDQARIQAAFASDEMVVKDLRTITVRSLVVVGDHDVLFPPLDATRLVAGLRHARELVLKDAGYGGMFQDSTQFVSALVAFVGPST